MQLATLPNAVNDSTCTVRRVWRYQKVNQNPNIEEEQTTQWQKENVQKDNQRSTKHTYEIKDRVNTVIKEQKGSIYTYFLWFYM
jgi:hypothetical protein